MYMHSYINIYIAHTVNLVQGKCGEVQYLEKKDTERERERGTRVDKLIT